MKKRFTLAVLAAVCCLVSNAAVSSIDDVVGTYTASTSGYQAVTDYTQWVTLSTGHEVTVEKTTTGTLSITNLLGLNQTLTASVDVDAKTVTIEPQTYYSWYTFAGDAATSNVEGSIDDEGKITFSSVNAWYGSSSYLYEASVTLTKAQPATVDWTVTGTISYIADGSEEPYHTAQTTLSKYSGSSSYDYVLAFDGASASPSVLKIKYYSDNDSIAIANGTSGYNGGYFYSAYGEDYCLWLEVGDDSYFKGDKDGGSLSVYSFDYATKESSTFTQGKLIFTWGTASGVKSIKASTASAAANAPVYDLMGRKVASPAAAGIYIKGGKKFVVK